ncbi:integral membrane protein [Micromonospora halophytica]|uniref:Integral membrane protein n=2 Tax=Micromonospora halophytica TaxID=47864 RepID=A0A1C5HWB6_9ACTN|nr:integral membrane protein [Micromonospora halophytica]
MPGRGRRARYDGAMREKTTRLFVAAAIAEACSWLALLVGMAVKYGPPANEIGVKIFGPVHGALFVAYGLLVLVMARTHRWSPAVTVVALVCSVPPFATLFFERWAKRRGLLDAAPRSQRPLTPVG